MRRELEETKRKAKDRKNEDERKMSQSSKTIKNLKKKLEQLEVSKLLIDVVYESIFKRTLITCFKGFI